MKSKMSFVLFFAVCFSLTAQITIDYSEIPMNAGLSWATCGDDSATVTVGTLGGPQTWNFTYLATMDLAHHRLITPSSAPSFSLFPTATKVEFIQDELYSSDSEFIYFEIIPSSFRTLGFEYIDPTEHIVMSIDQMQFDLPLDYLDSTNFYNFDTMFDSGPMVTTMETRIRAIVDAYGTVIIPMGSYPCLRIRQMETTISTMYFNSVPVYVDTSYSIIYTWLSENLPELVNITSCENDTNLYFTVADYTDMFAQFTGVEEEPVEETISACFLSRGQGNNYVLAFENAENALFELVDLSGRKIKEQRISGSGSLRIDTESSGVFFVRVRGKNIDFSGKINLF
ncbi:T9SS type A sorting domain-containing protein [candidate division WOR-3 bacterium]|nr:T9SS type A sorting domain-containing protein [candidate division WOR-3 bacterium]